MRGNVAYKNHSFVADSSPELGPANGTLLRSLFIAAGAFLAKAHVPAWSEEDVCRAGEAH